ncbi:30S ribosomal protein S7 [bacterium (Candidatus Gribaldobacteria) CG07_land_8_20_14_0_80_33_18]|uniref:Small ribosomal subunit protein uS7 n=1 Tax=bacterium (Candidatus Gribaldobacteria) CG07_land_8_20_14_0_80_33_18 TaxID=2014272 RepID=A0A2M6Z2Z3_9BACT|nr:MAG: 30S ribosomal protein S7 [bacterium (Candidatus Gribaldobacteria) CG10_big_fil_rev_8_21_14_0_10_33_41]PIU46715.1 MAG: 30S ribosomal protein S7 [bacterium (Candidatus Gribaldobacteria) CG07_land_8_20_14_0_80_33_18]PJA00546.1 MAG: 30S ribosomal protein S7 [bacterium (Candidatus Gribaldobacteria) CG_4_10_14_0_2_um_filter_33_15]PJB08900.1 MAG: 30S ribosomal protein S7 [bacterium (Candidatus Gribaldobacteria) CG_4_9_14_3_um_filter_33_9]
MAKKFKQHIIQPDSIYNNILVAKFINQIMRKGKKTIAQKIVYNAFKKIKEQTKEDPLVIFKKALENAGPLLEVRPQRIGGATYQIPREVNEKRRLSLALKWLVKVAKSKKGKPMEEKLASEIIAAFNNEGEVIRKKINLHKMAEANRAFASLAR